MAKAADLNVTVSTELVDVVELIPARVRTVIYAVAVTIGVLAVGADQVVPLWAPDLADEVTRTVNLVLAVVALATGALGTAYRPTRGALLPATVEPHPAVVNISAPAGLEVSEVSAAKTEAADILNQYHDGDNIETAERIVESLTAMGWRPTR